MAKTPDKKSKATAESPEEEPAEVPASKKPRSFGRLVLRVLAGFMVVVALVLGGLALLLTAFFPGEEIRPYAEEQLAAQFKMPARIGKIDLDLRYGLELTGVRLGGPDPFFQMDGVYLMYDLSDLLDGRLTINKVVIERPQIYAEQKNGVWNFQSLIKPAGPAPPPGPSGPAKKSAPSQDLGLPVEVDLQEFAINNISLRAKIEDDMEARLDGLTLKARGKLALEETDIELKVILENPKGSGQKHNLAFFQNGKQVTQVNALAKTDLTIATRDLNTVHLAGTLGIANSHVRMGKRVPTADMDIRFKASANLKKQVAHLPQFDFALGRGNRLSLSAEAKHFLGNPEFSLRIPKAQFDLAELASLGKPFMPPMTMAGGLSVTGFEVNGRLKNNQPEVLNLKSAQLGLRNLSLTHPKTKSQVHGMDMGLVLNRVSLKNNTPHHAEVDLNLAFKKVISGDISLNDLKQNLKLWADGANLPQAKASFKTVAGSAEMTVPQLGRVQTPVLSAGSFSGNITNGTVDDVRLSLDLGDMLSTQLSGKAKNFGQQSFQVKQTASLDFEQVFALLPPEMIEQFGIGALSGKGSTDYSIQGKLDAGNMPVFANVASHFSLENIAASVQKPSAEINGLNLTLDIPAQYNAKKGVQVQRLKLATDFADAKAMGKYKVGPTRLSTQLTSEGFVPMPGETADPIMTGNTFTLESALIHGAEPAFDLEGLQINLDSKAQVTLPAEVSLISLNGNIGFKSASALGEASTGPLKTRFKVDASDQTLTETHAVVEGEILSPTYKKDDLDVALKAVRFATDTSQNLESGDVDINKVTVDLPELAHLDIKGALQNWGKVFDVAVKLGAVQLKQVLAITPAKYKESIEGLELAGVLETTLKAKGTQPDEEAIKKLEIPVNADATLKLANVQINWPQQALKVEGFATDARLGFHDQDTELAGWVDMGRVSKTDLKEVPPLEPRFDFKYTIGQWDKITVNKHTFGLKSGRIGHTLKGRIEGLKKFLTGELEKTSPQFLKQLDIDLTTDATVDVAALAPFLPGIKADGGVGTQLDIKLLGNREIDINGEVAFDHLNAEHESGGKAKDIDGKFLVKKHLVLDRTLLEKDKDTFSASRKGFFNELREFSPYKNIFQIGAISFGPHLATDLGMDIFYNGNRLFIEKFLMEVLGASVAGNMFLTQTAEGPDLIFATEFAGLDLNELAGEQLVKAGRDSEVDGHLDMDFKISQGSKGQPVSLDQIIAKIAITHIGAEALDRVLLFIDPEESKPAIVDTRAKLQLASPHKLVVTLEHGNLNVEVWLYNKILGGVLKAPELKRVPISSLKKFKEINQSLQILADFQEVLQYLSARGLEFDDEGQIKFY